MILERICAETGLDLKVLRRIVMSANHRYKVYYVKKRKEGLRRIQHPSRELKFIQRWMADNIFAKLPTHIAPSAYIKNFNVKDVAYMHCAQNFLLILDLANFFESITQKDVFNLLNKNASLIDRDFTTDDALIMSRVATRYGRLTIGAPSSPVLSNGVMYEFDSLIYDICHKADVVYSRYADDMHFSTNHPDVLGEIATLARTTVERIGTPNLMLNEKKTVFTSRKHKRMVLGLTLTSDRRISIGRRRKRAIKALIFRYCHAMLSPEERAYLAGYLSFVKSVDPAFLVNLERKYGHAAVAQAMQLVTAGG